MADTAPLGPRVENPRRIGPYEIVQVLGEGGMGVVYEAEETSPVRRRVALKLVRAGLNTHDAVARFNAERRALAVMDHPGIAKVLHAGTTEAGQPYFAMELVRGLPIIAHCDARRLSVRERLELFIPVCQAVQHAHQKGVIHRDLKPSHVLVAEQEGVVQPKVIDFGISKALGPPLPDATLLTLGGQAIGTAAYMSPEQADGVAMDVDTRSDIYSLGVVLYELLVGQLPLDPASIGIHAFLAKLAAGQTNPPRPSAWLATMERDPEAVARLRRTDAKGLSRELRGDLDWIVMKAMHQDRAQRYPTANGLAGDLRRYLANEPVTARPPTTRYRIGKFVRRHRIGVLMAAAVSITVVASAITATVGFVRARRAEHLAAQEAEAARQVTAFLVDVFRVSDPYESRGNTLTALQILERGRGRAIAELSGQPVLQARMMQTMGTVYAALGQYERARELLGDALDVRERELGDSDPAVGETLAALGDLERAHGDHDAADQYFRRALAIREAAFGPEHIDVASTLGLLAALRFNQGRLGDAESLYLRVLALDQRVRRPGDPRLGRDMRGLAAVYQSQQRYREADSLLRATRELQERTLGSSHPDLGSTLNNLGAYNYSQGHFTEALPYYQQALLILEPALGQDHPTTASVINNLAEVHWKLGRRAEADSLFRRALAAKQRSLAPGNPSIAVTLNGLAGLRRDQGRYGEAEPLYRRALDIREQALGSAHPLVGETLRDYAEMLRRAGRAGEARLHEARAASIK